MEDGAQTEEERRRNATCRAAAKSEYGGKRHASAGKKRAGGTSPIASSPKTTTSGTQYSFGGRLCQHSATQGSSTHGRNVWDGEGRFWLPGPILWNPAPFPSWPRPSGGLSRPIQLLLTWGPRAECEGTCQGRAKGVGEAP